MNSAIYDKLQAGIQHQQNGELQAAEELYRQILDESPNHPDALHLLGVLAYQIGEYDVAEDLIRHAIEANFQVADYHNNLGEVLRATNRLDEAREQYQHALIIDPDHANAQSNLEKLAQDTPKKSRSSSSQNASTEMVPEVRHALPSYVLSMDDEEHGPNKQLIDLALLAAHKASTIYLGTISDRFEQAAARFINVWPGEHYRILAAIIDIVKPGLVVEIGTAAGAGALTIKKYLPTDGKLITYDLTPWQDYPGCGLQEDDFDEQMQQRTTDLCEATPSDREGQTLQQADIIFIDPGTDNQTVQRICDLLDSLHFSNPPLVIIDDIRTMPLLKTWRSLRHPKLDLTSFGHWSGTGLVEWSS